MRIEWQTYSLWLISSLVYGFSSLCTHTLLWKYPRRLVLFLKVLSVYIQQALTASYRCCPFQDTVCYLLWLFYTFSWVINNNTALYITDIAIHFSVQWALDAFSACVKCTVCNFQWKTWVSLKYGFIWFEQVNRVTYSFCSQTQTPATKAK